MNNRMFLTPLFIVTLIVSACSPQPKELSFGEKIQSESSETAKIGKNWMKGENLITDGNQLVRDGNKDIQRGEKLLSKGESKVDKGDAMIKKGTRMKNEAEEIYKEKARENEA